MSRGIILYQSKYGATKKYVDWLVEELGYDYIETKDAKVAKLLNYDVIILGGGVYASGRAYCTDFLPRWISGSGAGVCRSLF